MILLVVSAEQLSPTARVLVVGSELSLLSLKLAALLPGACVRT